MSKSSSSSSSGGVGFVGLLTILFIGLKLTGFIDWSWWWVLSPLWITAAIILGILVIGLIAIAIGEARDRRNPMRRVARSAHELSEALRRKSP